MPKKADYHGALQRAVEVRPIIHETYDGLHRTASRTLREMAGVYATRLAGSAGGRRARTFRSFHRRRISCALFVRWPKGSPSSSATACGSSARVASPAAARERGRAACCAP